MTSTSDLRAALERACELAFDGIDPMTPTERAEWAAEVRELRTLAATPPPEAGVLTGDALVNYEDATVEAIAQWLEAEAADLERLLGSGDDDSIETMREMARDIRRGKWRLDESKEQP